MNLITLKKMLSGRQEQMYQQKRMMDQLNQSRTFNKRRQLMEILQKKELKSAQTSNSDTEPPMHGQYMWELC